MYAGVAASRVTGEDLGDNWAKNQLFGNLQLPFSLSWWVYHLLGYCDGFVLV